MNPWVYVGLNAADKYVAIYKYKRSDKSPLEYILAAIEMSTDITVVQVKGKTRKRAVSEARHCFCFLAQKYTMLPLEVIGEHINRHHSTVIHSIRTAEALLETDQTFAELMNILELGYLTMKSNNHAKVKVSDCQQDQSKDSI